MAVIVPIFKKGDSSLCDNYRGISLLSVVGKIYERIIENRLRKVLEPTLQGSQAGFRPGRSTQDWIFTIRQICEKTLQKNGKLYLCAIDLEKAFDTIPRKRIWECLERKGVPKSLLLAVRSFYAKTTNIVRTSHGSTENFVTYKGVRQGAILSPLLFITFMDDIARKANATVRGCRVGVRKLRPVYVKELLYADDLMLISKSKSELQNALEKWKKVLTEAEMRINPDKTEVMVVSKNEESLDLRLDGRRLKQARTIKYLGSILDCEGNIESDINNRIGATARLFNALKSVFLNKKEVSKKTKVKIHKAVFEPVLTYGSESWVMNKKLKSKVQAMEMRILRKIEGVTKKDKIRNTEIRRRLNVQSVHERIEKRQLSWYGHLVRMKEGNLVKEVWEAKAEEKNRRGRPKKGWNAEIAEVISRRGETWSSAKEMANDRNKWRRFCKTESTLDA